MKFLCSNVIATGVCIAITLSHCAIPAAKRKPKAKVKKYGIDFNNSYYTSQFSACKKLRMSNPVENFKAQGWAAHVFGKCGPKMIVELGSKYQFPAYGLMKLGHHMCLTINWIYGFLASDGTLIIPESTPSSKIVELITKLVKIMRISNHTLVMKNPGSIFKVNASMMADFANHLIPCVFDTEKVDQADGDYQKHIIHHSLVMLL